VAAAGAAAGWAAGPAWGAALAVGRGGAGDSVLG